MDNIENFEDLKKSFEVINNQMVENLKKLGLEEIQTQGQVFDPNLHEAVMKTPSEDHADETIIAELQKGYKLKDKVLLPALVNVAVKN